jgi:hypothetical protein
MQVRPPGDDVAVYDVMVEPPLVDGATHDTVTVVPLATPVTPVGGPGATAGTVTPAEAADGALGPTTFVARTTNVYVVPGVRPPTVQLGTVTGAKH